MTEVPGGDEVLRYANVEYVLATPTDSIGVRRALVAAEREYRRRHNIFNVNPLPRGAISVEVDGGEALVLSFPIDCDQTVVDESATPAAHEPGD